MAYVLDIRRGTETTDGESAVAALCDALRAHGRVEDTGDGFVWTVGDTRLRFVRTRDESGAVDGVDVEIPFGAANAEVETALGHLLSAVDDRGLGAFDPQLGRRIGTSERGTVQTSFEEASSYHVELAGQAEDVRQGLASAEEGNPRSTKVSTQAKVLVGIVVVLGLAYLGFQSCVVTPVTRQMTAVTNPDAGTASGPPPGWLDRHPTTLSPDAVKLRGADGGR